MRPILRKTERGIVKAHLGRARSIIRNLAIAGGAGLLLASCVSVPLSRGQGAADPVALASRASVAPADPSGGRGRLIIPPVTGVAAYRPPIGAVPFANRRLSPTQWRLLAGARYVLGKTRLVVNGQHFNDDCSGTILAIYAYAGVNLVKRFRHYTGSGVVRIYKIMKAHHLLYKSYYPQPGDIIFWNNTYDANGDGKWDDPLTHAGMVVGVGPSGEITFIHQNYRLGIVLAKMNLLYPSIYTRIIDGIRVMVNSPMRMRGSPPGPYWLSGQLIASLGKGYLLKS